MQTAYIKNSLVIIAKNHNPSLFSDTFLLRTGLIDDPEKIIKDSFLVTPPFSQVNIKDGCNINVDQDRLIISSNKPADPEPYKLGYKYCKALGYIKGIAIGINAHVKVNTDADAWFASYKLNDNTTCERILFKHEKNCNITVEKDEKNKLTLKMNFHYDFKQETMLQDIDFNFEQEWKNAKNKIKAIVPLFKKS